MQEIDDVLEPLDLLTALLGTLSCMRSNDLLLNADDLSMTFIHLSGLAHEAQEKFEALHNAIEKDTAEVQEAPTKKAKPKKKGG